MKSVNNIIALCCYVILGVLFAGAEVSAAESSDGWRPLYDEILLWINFGIIVFLFVAYAKKPLMNFLRGQKEEIKQELDKLEEEKEKAAGKVKEIIRELEESKINLAKLKDRIIQQGEKKKQVIIEGAQLESKLTTREAKRRIDSQIVQAKNTFRSELVDAAIAMATKRLSSEVADEDNRKLLDQYLASLSSE